MHERPVTDECTEAKLNACPMFDSGHWFVSIIRKGVGHLITEGRSRKSEMCSLCGQGILRTWQKAHWFELKSEV